MNSVPHQWQQQGLRPLVDLMTMAIGATMWQRRSSPVDASICILPDSQFLCEITHHVDWSLKWLQWWG